MGAPGWCCSWLADSGIPDPALGSLGVGTAPEPGCEMLWVPIKCPSGCPRALWSAGLVPIPIPWPSSRAVAWKAAGVKPRPGAEQSLEQIFPVLKLLWASWGKAATAALGMMDAFPAFPRTQFWDESLRAAATPAGASLGCSVGLNPLWWHLGCHQRGQITAGPTGGCQGDAAT